MAHVKRGRREETSCMVLSKDQYSSTTIRSACSIAGWALVLIMLLCLPVRVIGLLHVIRIAFCLVVEYGRVNCA